MQSLLQQKNDEDDQESGEQVEYDYYKILLTGTGSDKVRTLLFIKKMFSCDYAQAKTYLAETPLVVYKGIESGSASIEDQLKSIGADYEKLQISWEEFIGI
ncbi:hypothetical protein ACFFSY_35010 [Paenibacillus aurantiacus]|uniref:BRCT domain-containing protein n=1 Tax=Paenibacillus aurantiacus TaxID=1936118 RepID=A0ABV5L110_9BACL